MKATTDRQATRSRRVKALRKVAKERNAVKKKLEKEATKSIAQNKKHLAERRKKREIRKMLEAGQAEVTKNGKVIRTRVNAAGKKVLAVGAPDKRTDKILTEKLLTALRNGHTDKEAAIFAGVSPGVLYGWLREGIDASEGTLAHDFYKSVELAKTEALDEFLQSIRRASGRSWQAAAWWLERRKPEVYGKKAELMLNQATPFELALTDASFSDDEIKAAMRAYLSSNPDIAVKTKKIKALTLDAEIVDTTNEHTNDKSSDTDDDV